MIRVIVAVMVAVLLTACSPGGPSRAVVERAIALQLNQVQQDLAPQLYRGSSGTAQFNIDRIKISAQKPVTIQDEPSYRVQGNYRLTVEFPDKRFNPTQTSFDLYLQSHRDDKTWSLARPLNSTDDLQQTTWAITPIP